MVDNDVRVYFDTEFTGLRKDTDLISIGMVVNDPEINLYKAFYIEFDDYDKNKLTPWVEENVIANLIFGKVQNHPEITTNYFMASCNKKSANTFIYTWLKEIYDRASKHNKDTKIQLVSDVCHYDFVLFLDIFGTALDLPEFISPTCLDLNSEIADFCNIPLSLAFDYSRERMIRVLDDVFELYKVSPPQEIQELEKILPKVVQNRKHNALYDAFIISKLEAYMRDAYTLKIFE